MTHIAKDFKAVGGSLVYGGRSVRLGQFEGHLFNLILIDAVDPIGGDPVCGLPVGRLHGLVCRHVKGILIVKIVVRLPSQRLISLV